MMGQLEAQENLFYRFRIEDHVPKDHLLRKIDWLLDFDAIRAGLTDLHSHTGRPSVDPELMLRMLLIGYLYGIRSERRLVEEVHLNLAYRWFCKLGLESRVPDRSTFSKNRHGRFADGDVMRRLFESVVEKCVGFGFVGGTDATVDGSTIEADANRDRKDAPHEIEKLWSRKKSTASRCRLPCQAGRRRPACATGTKEDATQVSVRDRPGGRLVPERRAGPLQLRDQLPDRHRSWDHHGC
nr:transposase [Jannaschia sp. CCS1]